MKKGDITKVYFTTIHVMLNDPVLKQFHNGILRNFVREKIRNIYRRFSANFLKLFKLQTKV